MSLTNPAAEYDSDRDEEEVSGGVDVRIGNSSVRLGKVSGSLASGAVASKEVVCLALGSSKPRAEYPDILARS